MAEDVNFVDLVALTRITAESVVEKFGSSINSSFFDASNILATLKQKGLVDFTTAFPGQSAITVTEQGKQLLNEAHDKANTPFDQLDLTVLTQLSTGKRSIQDLGQSVNVTPKDLALRVFKLAQNGHLSYDIRNGSVSISLTEKGFLQVKSGMPQAPTPAKGEQPQTAQQQAAQKQMMQQGFQQNPQTQQAAPAGPGAPQNGAPAAEAGQAMPPSDNLEEIQEMIRKKKRRMMRITIAAIAVVVVVVIILIALDMDLFRLA